MSKRGRPKLPKRKTKGVFSLRFSKDELAAMSRTAKRSGQKIREWARKCLLETVSRDIR
jgi:predicted HicB family RNase H-like nuclease